MIIVTGARKGLGQAIAHRFVEKGHRVIGVSRTQSEDVFKSYACDVSDYNALKKTVRDIRGLGEPVTAVINAAGIASMNLAVTTDHDTVQKLIQTNLVGTINVCQLFAPLMLRQKSGCFVNFSTIAVALALKGESVYAASKAGVEAFSRSFAREMADFNVRVNCVAPGPIDTDLLHGISDRQIKNITDQQIFQKTFNKQDVCDVVELLTDPKSASITGQILHIGGV